MGSRQEKDFIRWHLPLCRYSGGQHDLCAFVSQCQSVYGPPVYRLQKAGIKIAMEIPTYPYDSEYKGFPFFTRCGLQIDRLFRKTLAKRVNGIVTFSDEKTIFGQRTVRISNGVDFDTVPLRKTINNNSSPTLHLIGVAEVHYWHGLRPTDTRTRRVLPTISRQRNLFPYCRRSMEIRNVSFATRSGFS